MNEEREQLRAEFDRLAVDIEIAEASTRDAFRIKLAAQERRHVILMRLADIGIMEVRSTQANL